MNKSDILFLIHFSAVFFSQLQCSCKGAGICACVWRFLSHLVLVQGSVRVALSLSFAMLMQGLIQKNY